MNSKIWTPESVKFCLFSSKTFKENCEQYTTLNKYIMESDRTKIIYNKTLL
mgnify:CR=1 FL=1